ncbi:Box C/D snoRNA protein 1 [Hypsizygus marmoreus]|uniref:Box C/D snoRNA protein 1 n=1 Tax=Hypsizygus marmoreus TaxID=39966 RepID=A0A369JS38_HYPMA|nr:Box C/D snoRNA protein 1 [Hypsizygus marmoreus]
MADALLPSNPPPPEASTSAPLRQLCSICNHKYSIYTCPRCLTRTCSLPCSNSHKSATGCTGERDKVAYVPMNKYGWGTMMNDYVFLEDVGRRVGGWGKEIVSGGFDMRATTRGGAGRGRGDRGRGRGRARGVGTTKRDILKIQLEARDIDMELLPMGMERRKLNQSYWEPKNHAAFLTIEFKFHPPKDPLAPSSQLPDPPFVLLTHRNSINTSLLSLVKSVSERAKARKDNPAPQWITRFLSPDADDPDSFTLPQFVMPAQIDPRSAAMIPKSQAKTAYYRFDPSKTLMGLLRNTHFVEYPTIELWEEFSGTVVDVEGAVTQQPEGERAPKRRKLSGKAGKKTISGLLGGYGSEGDEEEEKEAQNGLTLLTGYAGSDDEASLGGDEEASDGDADEDIEIDPAVLLELMRQAQGSEKWAEHVGGDDMVDWGDSEEDEP